MLEDFKFKIQKALSEPSFWNSHFQTEPLISSLTMKNSNVFIIVQVKKPFDSEDNQKKFEDKIKDLLGEDFTLNIGYEIFKQAPTLEQKKTASQTKRSISGIQKIYLVASGKGGVGKSTTSLQIALGLAQKGLKVGILDADIYGPSLATLTGISKKPDVTVNKKIIPFEKKGLSLMSLSFLVSADKATIWRGPMAQSALLQLLFEVEWTHHGSLDVLIIDTPPGTGDIHLSLIQKLVIDGVVLVTTPQRMAVVDAIKAQDMFLKLNIPILGYVENMAYVGCSNCHHHQPLFIKDNTSIHNLKVPQLASIPHLPQLMSDCDEGVMTFYEEYKDAIIYLISIMHQSDF